MFHDFSDWGGTKANIWTAAATRWTRGSLLAMFLRRPGADFTTTNIPDVCHASSETASELDFCVWHHDWQLQA